MKCIACGRLLKAYTVSIETPEGRLGWGPVCALRVTVRKGRGLAQPVVRRREVRVDPRQCELFGAAA